MYRPLDRHRFSDHSALPMAVNSENFVESIRRRKEDRNPKVLQDRKGVTSEIFERRPRGAIKWGGGVGRCNE